MKKNKVGILLILSALVCFLASGCGNKKRESDGSKMIDLKKIKKVLVTGKITEKETPFTVRKFTQYTGSEWIGNAVSYGCYREGQAPGVKGPSETEILEDLNIISKHWKMIRVYGADDDSERILKVIRENDLPVKMMLGIWIENETGDSLKKENNIQQALKGIELGNKYSDLISSINVGNETQVYWTGHKVDVDDLVRYIRVVRANTTVPVTTADDYNFWNKEESGKVSEEIDFIVTHMYPLWNGKTLDESLEWMDDVFSQVKKMHPDKDIVLGEIGWATKYNPAKTGPGEEGTLIKGEVSLEAQEKFLIQLHKWAMDNKVVTFLFEAFDEPWKGGGETAGPDEVEKNWGVFYENRSPKESFTNYLKSIDELRLQTEN